MAGANVTHVTDSNFEAKEPVRSCTGNHGFWSDPKGSPMGSAARTVTGGIRLPMAVVEKCLAGFVDRRRVSLGPIRTVVPWGQRLTR